MAWSCSTPPPTTTGGLALLSVCLCVGCLEGPALTFGNPCDPRVSGGCPSDGSGGQPGSDALGGSAGGTDLDSGPDATPRPDLGPVDDGRAPDRALPDGGAADVSGGLCPNDSVRPCPLPAACPGSTQTCLDERWAPCAAPAEVCDGTDNDCDDEIDEGDAGAGPCSTGLSGACGEGVGRCEDGEQVCEQTVTPVPDICDGVDNNCDGSRDEGLSAGATQRLTGSPMISRTPRVARSAAGFGIAWEESTEIHFARLAPDGRLATPLVQVTMADGASESPSIVGTDAGYTLVWIDQRERRPDFYFTNIDPDGARLLIDRQIVRGETSPRTPSLAWSGEFFGLVWRATDMGTPSVRFAALDPDGNLPNVARTLFPGSDPDIEWAADHQLFGLVWQNVIGATQIFFTVMADRAVPCDDDAACEPMRGTCAGGRCAPTPIQLTDTPQRSTGPQLAYNAGIFGVVWEDERDENGGAEIYFGAVTVDGMMAAPTRISRTAAVSDRPRIAPLTDDSFVVSWMDRPDGRAELWFAELAVDGTLRRPPAPLTVDPDPQNPSARLIGDVAGGDGVLALVWEDGRDGNLEIYTAFGPLSCE